jgi:hypothetical protein
MSVRRCLAVLASLVLLLPGLPAIAASRDTGTTSWRAGAFLPAAADGLTAVRLGDGSVVAVGGEAALTAHTRMAALLSPGAASWARLPDAPVDLDTPAALVLTPETVMIVAPSYASYMLASPSKALLLDVLHRTWTMLPEVPIPLLRPALYRLDMTRVIAVGAVGGPVGAVFDLHRGRWAAIGSPLPNLASYTTVMLPGRGMMMMITVAIDGHLQPYPVRRASLLDSSLRWVPLAPPPYTADGAVAVVLGVDRVLFACGRPAGDDPAAQAPRPLLYVPSSNAWIIAGSTGQNHRGGSLVGLSGGRALLIGGHSALGEPTMECLLFAGLTWGPAAPLPGPWAGFAAVAVDESHVLLLGGDRSGPTTIGPVADTIVWSFDPATAA